MHRSMWTNWVIEFGPLAVFFILLYGFDLGRSERANFLIATGILTVLTVFSMIAARVREGRLALFPIVAGAFIVSFGAVSVFSGSPAVFIVKDTLYYGLFGLLLLIGCLRGQGWLKAFFEGLLDISDRGWYLLSLRWSVFFLLLAVSNEYVSRHYHLDVWIHYKLAATILLNLFGWYQFLLIRRYRNPAASAWGLRLEPVPPK